MISQQQLAVLMPLACQWAEQQESTIIRTGVPLTESQLKDARSVGVQRPELVRLQRVARVSLPDHPALQAAAQHTGLISSNTVGLTLRYGIFVRADYWGNRNLITHELVHTSQYERLGGVRQFLERYLLECVTIGYPAAPMEQEAVNVAARVCRN